MKNKINFVVVGISLLACNFLFPQTRTLPSTESASQSNNTEDSAPSGFTIVRLHPEDGDLQEILAEEAEKSIALDQIPVVEFDADWCPPCQAIDAAIKSKK